MIWIIMLGAALLGVLMWLEITDPSLDDLYDDFENEE